MDETITEGELRQHLAEALERVRVRGERITIDRDGKAIAMLAPVQPQPATWRMVAARLAEIEYPGEGFADDVEAGQAQQRRPESPAWPS